MSKITDYAFLFQKSFGTSGVNAIGSFQLSQLNSSSVQSKLKAAGINTNSKQYKAAVKQMMSAGNGAMYGNIQGIKNLMSHYDKDGDYINPVNGLAGLLVTDDNENSRRRIISIPDSSKEEMYELTKKEWTSIRGKRISMIFQEPMTALNPLIKVGKQVRECLLTHQKGISKKEAKSLVLEQLKSVGLPDVEDLYECYPHQLSGGQQQRVAIARAVVTNARLLLADEPTGNLDSTNGVEVMELLSTLNKQGTTIIIVTHSQRDAAYAHRIIRLLDGKIIAENRNRPMESDSKIEIL